jgi:acyl carrier protein
VTTITDFVELVRDHLGLDVTPEQLATGFDELPGWDSVQLLALCIALEQATGQDISLPDMLDATSLGHIYQLVAS